MRGKQEDKVVATSIDASQFTLLHVCLPTRGLSQYLDISSYVALVLRKLRNIDTLFWSNVFSKIVE